MKIRYFPGVTANGVLFSAPYGPKSGKPLVDISARARIGAMLSDFGTQKWSHETARQQRIEAKAEHERQQKELKAKQKELAAQQKLEKEQNNKKAEGEKDLAVEDTSSKDANHLGGLEGKVIGKNGEEFSNVKPETSLLDISAENSPRGAVGVAAEAAPTDKKPKNQRMGMKQYKNKRAAEGQGTAESLGGGFRSLESIQEFPVTSKAVPLHWFEARHQDIM